jgi:hypothetical protein
VLRGPYTYESGSRVRHGSGSSESNSSECGSPRSYVCGEINPSPAPRRARLVRVWAALEPYFEVSSCEEYLLWRAPGFHHRPRIFKRSTYVRILHTLLQTHSLYFFVEQVTSTDSAFCSHSGSVLFKASFCSWVGVRLSPLGTPATFWPIVQVSDDR